jgi:hypothetical protein
MAIGFAVERLGKTAWSGAEQQRGPLRERKRLQNRALPWRAALEAE